MAAKMFIKHIQTVKNTSTSSIIRSSSLVHRRLFSEATLPETPPLESDLENPGNAKKVVMKTGTINEAELARFGAIADRFWEVDGPYKPLHELNPTRVAFIRSTLCRHFQRDPSSPHPFTGLRIVDVGCGGGLLSEPLARMGASVTGVDACSCSVQTARDHADMDPTTSSIEYICATPEKLVEQNRKFDAVISLEVIEHVDEPENFCKSISELVVPGGAMVISTPNRTVKSYGAVIVAAEYLLQWVPVGTHEWTKFVTPEELTMVLQRNAISVQEIAGFVNNPITGQWFISHDTSLTYIVFATKNNDAENHDPAL